jgi:hypothetical protein
MPSSSLSSFDHLEYLFSKDSGVSEAKSPQDGFFVLELGSYALTVNAYMGPEANSLAAQGTSEPFTVTGGSSGMTIAVIMRPFVTGEGTGTLEFSLSWPDDAFVQSFTLTPIAGEDEDAY